MEAQEIRDVTGLLAAGKCIDRRLSIGGRLYIDRPLPFLCLYRQPAERRDEITDRLITTQASYLIASSDAAHHEHLSELVNAIAGAMSARFGSFLLLEIWCPPTLGEAEKDDPYSLQPQLCVVAPDRSDLEDSNSELVTALKRIRIHEYAAEVSLSCSEHPSPPEYSPIVPTDGRHVHLGLEVAPIYRNEASGEIYPFLFDSLRRQLAAALKKGAFAFAERHTSYRAPGYLALGRRAFEQAVARVDEGLARIDESFDFLLQITPVNAEEARLDFEENGYEQDPTFRYRPLPVDPEILKRRLFDLPIEEVEDPSLAWVFREKQEELDRKITMLRDRDTRQFFFESLQLYGEVKQDLLAEARSILDHLPPRDDDLESAENLDAEAFAEVAAAEFLQYREHCDDFPETVNIRRDMPPGLMVSRGRLLIGHLTKVPAPRVDALLHHEVGTHMLTYYNGRAQPLRLLYNGLAGYEALQEGIAVLSEYLAGGLNAARLRVLAARVVGAHCLVEGASFSELYERLRDEHGFEHNECFSIALRTFRGGGLIKDVVYLRGLHELLHYLQGGGDFDALLSGKIALHHLPVLEELRAREVLRPSPLRPRYLLDEDALERLERVRRGATFLDMIEKTAS